MSKHPSTGLYCGSFDPIHNGHIAIIKAALERVDRLIVAVCGNPAKQSHYLFGLPEAGALTKYSLDIARLLEEDRVRVITSEHSMVNIALDFGVDYIVRGFRDADEQAMEIKSFEHISDLLPCNTKCILLNTGDDFKDLSSSKLKYIVSEGGSVAPFTTPAVKTAMEGSILGLNIYAVIGPPVSGKSAFCEKLGAYHYELNAEPEKVLTAEYPGAVRVASEVERLSETPITRWRDIDDNDSELLHLLAPYASRDRRQFLKKTKGPWIVIEDDTFRGLHAASGAVIIYGPENDPLIESMEEEAKQFFKTFKYGQICRATDDSTQTLDRVQDQLSLYFETRRQYYAEGWAVPTHKEARRRGLWNDDAGGAHSNG